MKDFKYTVIIDGRSYEFTGGRTALEFANIAIEHMIKKSWETELPDVAIKVELVEEELEEEEEDIHCDEELERVCEA